MYAAVAALAALARKQKTGKGDHIDIGMLDVMVASLANQAMNYLISGNAPKRYGNRHPNIQPQDVFASRNGHIVLAVGNDGQFAKFCAVIGQPELARDERFATNAARVRNERILTPLIAEIIAQRDKATWIDLLGAAGVPCGPINTLPDLFKDPQVVHREMLIKVDHAAAGPISLVASPMHFADATLSYRQAPPLLGQHSEEILRELTSEDKGQCDSVPAGEGSA
jgi:crotonobetainyl-CoA:carnitine CoA-transferase CaiB-like acyl-CoA transferase